MDLSWSRPGQREHSFRVPLDPKAQESQRAQLRRVHRASKGPGPKQPSPRRWFQEKGAPPPPAPGLRPASGPRRPEKREAREETGRSTYLRATYFHSPSLGCGSTSRALHPDLGAHRTSTVAQHCGPPLYRWAEPSSGQSNKRLLLSRVTCTQRNHRVGPTEGGAQATHFASYSN